jgi:23S rRNA (adenine2503-C2)-methyltransferase
MLTFEYILMAGVNDSPAAALKVARLLKGIRCKFNLIAFNEFPGCDYRTPAPQTVSAFQQILKAIRKRDPGMAEKAIRKHIASVASAVKKYQQRKMP